MRAFLERGVILALTGAMPLYAQTHISSTGMGSAPQQLAGVWRYASDGEHRRFIFLANGMLLITFLDGGDNMPAQPRHGERIARRGYDGAVGRLSLHQRNSYRGHILFVEADPDKCREWAWWGPATVNFDGLKARTITDGRKIDEQCRLTQTPNPIDHELERVVGVRFAQVASGRYIHLVMTSDRRAYRAAVRLAWDYASLSPQRVRLSVRGAGGTQPIGDFTATGSREYVTESPGRIEFVVEVLNRQGRVIHVDRAIADIPRV